jgi:hypothetical protein
MHTASLGIESFYSIVSGNLFLREEHAEKTVPVDPILQEYYVHVQELFLKRFGEFTQLQKPTEAQRKRVVGLFTEMMRVKAILIGEDDHAWSKLC